MTTIAVDLDRMAMAGDSKCSDGGATFLTQKVFRAQDGSLVGICGSLSDATLFVEWYLNGADRAARPPFSAPDTFSALTLGPEGCHQWDSACCPWPMLSRQYAMGSGAIPARVALICGKTIEQAVEIASMVDDYTGGPVTSLAYQPPKPRRSRAKPATASAKTPAKPAKKAPRSTR